MPTIYLVTGKLRSGRRFKAIKFRDLRMALMINLWHGSVWEVRNGHRKLIRHVHGWGG